MTLLDTGPFVAIINTRDDAHEQCRRQLAREQPPLVTTWAVLTETMHMLWRPTRAPGQAAAWRLVTSGVVAIADMSDPMTVRCRELMAKYDDLPMDLADATLVALAEARNENLIFTLDSDFEVYRLSGRRKFTIVPA